MASLQERFDAKVRRLGADECWPFQGAIGSGGYGHMRDELGRSTTAHRIAYRLYVGEIPDGEEIDHVAARGCAGGSCVNPAHLEAVAHKVNVRRFFELQTRCKHGHDYTPENTGRDSRGHRFCRRCERERRAGASTTRAA